MFAAPWAFATRSRPEYDGPNGRHERPVVDRLLRRVGPLTACMSRKARAGAQGANASLSGKAQARLGPPDGSSGACSCAGWQLIPGGASVAA